MGSKLVWQAYLVRHFTGMNWQVALKSSLLGESFHAVTTLVFIDSFVHLNVNIQCMLMFISLKEKKFYL